MRKHLYLILTLAAMLCIVSCSESSDSLSDSTAKSLVKKEFERLNRMDGSYAIQTGYFECNDNQMRYLYRQLAANDLITYKCDKVKKTERVQKTRKVTRYGFWGYKYTDTERYWVNEDVDTYFVTIELTEKGKKLIAEEKEVEPSDDDKEMKYDMEVDNSKFPESKVQEDEFAEPAPPAPAEVEEVVEVDTVAADSVAVAEEIAPQPEPQPQPKANEKKKSEYELAKEKESIEVVLLKAYEIKIIKARNILKTGDYSAVAEIVAEYTNVNAVGRIFGGLSEGGRFLLDNISYVYYQDKGWQVKLNN